MNALALALMLGLPAWGLLSLDRACRRARAQTNRRDLMACAGLPLEKQP